MLLVRFCQDYLRAQRQYLRYPALLQRGVPKPSEASSLLCARQEQAEADLRFQGAILDRQFEEMYRRIGGSKIIII